PRRGSAGPAWATAVRSGDARRPTIGLRTQTHGGIIGVQKAVVDMSDTKKESEAARTRAVEKRPRKPRRHRRAAQSTVAAGSMSAGWAEFGENVAELVGATTEVQPQRMTDSLRDAMERVTWARTAPI